MINTTSFKAIAIAATCLFSLIASPVAAQTVPSPQTTGYRFDEVGRLTGTIAPDPDETGPLKFPATRYFYGAGDNPVRVEVGELNAWQSEGVSPSAWPGFSILSSTETSYDGLDRKTKTISRGSDSVITSVVQYGYDSLGRQECAAQRMNPAAYGSLPASACTLGTEGSFGPDRITRNVYDAGGQLLKVQKTYGTPLAEDYATYTYSPNGKRTSLTDARGYLATMTYDGFDRQTRWNFPSPTTAGVASTTDYEEYGYDANGNRTSLRKRDGSTITYQYDALNRNTVKIVPERSGLAATHTRDVYYGYDLRGLQTYARFDSPAGEGLTSSYDGFGRLISSTMTMDGTARVLSNAWDKNGNRTWITYPDGFYFGATYDGLDRQTGLSEYTSPVLRATSYNSRGLVASDSLYASQLTQYGYDPAGRLNALSHDPAGAAEDVAFSYGYTPASQIAQQARDNDAYAWTAHFNVDRNYTANGLNQYTTAGPASFGYDANGNLTSDGSTSFVYDAENRLVSASGVKNASLRYDPLGRLYETVGGGNTTRFLYDGDELVVEYDGSGNLLRRYAHGRGVDDPVVWYEAGPGWPNFVRRLVRDHQGSIVAVLDAAGAAIAVNSYDEYGIPNVGNIGRFQYTGQAWLPELGMYYYKARIYSPTLGRFLQTDPIGYKDQINLYAYSRADPLNNIDPSGEELMPMCPGTDPSCTMSDLVTAPLTAAENKENDRLRGQDPAGPIGSIVASSVGNAIYDSIVENISPDTIDNLATSYEIGVAGEAETLRAIMEEGWTVLGKHVTIQTAAGTRVADFLVADGLGGHLLVEVKANSARRSFSQARKDHVIETYGGVIRARNPFIDYGARIYAKTAVVQVTVTRQ